MLFYKINLLRTSAGADSFFVVQKLLCSNIPGTVVTQRTYGNEPPIKIDIFISPIHHDCKSDRLDDSPSLYNEMHGRLNQTNGQHSINSNKNTSEDTLNHFNEENKTNITPMNTVCARIEVMNSFAIYDTTAIDNITGIVTEDPPAWLEVETVVVDETNFTTEEQHWRQLQLLVTCPATGKVSP